MVREGGNKERMKKCREWISLHFLILSPFPHFLSISSLSLHFLFISHSRSIFSHPGCKDAASCATLSSSIHNPFQFRAAWEQSCPQEDAPIVSGHWTYSSYSSSYHIIIFTFRYTFTILPLQSRATWEQSCLQEDAPIVSGRGDGGSRSCWLQERLSDHPDHHCLKRCSVYIIQSSVPSQMWSFLYCLIIVTTIFLRVNPTKTCRIPITFFF